MGIQAINPFELPLLNTVNCVIKMAVWVKTPLYVLDLAKDYLFVFFSVLYPFYKKLFFWKKKISVATQIIKYTTSASAPAGLGQGEKNSASAPAAPIFVRGQGDEFNQWFVGFSDAEGSFGIFSLSDGFSFNFTIGLHIDDLPVLNHIKKTLGFGSVYAYKDKCYYRVNKIKDIFKLISIFDTFALNTSKHLDYLDFQKAFFLYKERTKLSKELRDKILEIKNNMNSQRTSNYIRRPQAVITKSWLLGFIEGDGSFSLSRTTLEPIFSIKLSESQLPLLMEIKKYLETNLGFDKYSLSKLNISPIISISKNKSGNNSKPLAILTIKNVHFLHNYFIPFFSECHFISKKGLVRSAINDFKIICKAIYIGAYRNTEIKNLIIKLSLTMNNYRLSSYQGKVDLLNLVEKNLIINAKPTIGHLSDGRQIDLETKKIIHRRSSSCIYEIIKPTNEIVIKPNLAEAAKEIGVGFNTLKRQLSSELEGQIVEYKGYKIKRIAVFYPPK
jgi:hypothetical protein